MAGRNQISAWQDTAFWPCGHWDHETPQAGGCASHPMSRAAKDKIRLIGETVCETGIAPRPARVFRAQCRVQVRHRLCSQPLRRADGGSVVHNVQVVLERSVLHPALRAAIRYSCAEKSRNQIRPYNAAWRGRKLRGLHNSSLSEAGKRGWSGVLHGGKEFGGSQFLLSIERID